MSTSIPVFIQSPTSNLGVSNFPENSSQQTSVPTNVTLNPNDASLSPFPPPPAYINPDVRQGLVSGTTHGWVLNGSKDMNMAMEISDGNMQANGRKITAAHISNDHHELSTYSHHTARATPNYDETTIRITAKPTLQTASNGDAPPPPSQPQTPHHKGGISGYKRAPPSGPPKQAFPKSGVDLSGRTINLFRKKL